MRAESDKLAPASDALGRAQLATRLLKGVIVKLFVELIFVCAVVSFAAFAYFNPALRGGLEAVNAERVEGWAYNPLAPEERLEVQLFIDGRFVAAAQADQPRQDLVAARVVRHAAHGFSFKLAGQPLASGKHRAQVYVVHGTPGGSRTLIPVSRRPRSFEVIANYAGTEARAIN